MLFNLVYCKILVLKKHYGRFIMYCIHIHKQAEMFYKSVVMLQLLWLCQSLQFWDWLYVLQLMIVVPTIVHNNFQLIFKIFIGKYISSGDKSACFQMCYLQQLGVQQVVHNVLNIDRMRNWKKKFNWKKSQFTKKKTTTIKTCSLHYNINKKDNKNNK